jgi:glycosyltransferase involved in cell wall biosynthesis
MKLLQVSKFYFPVHGGIESVAYELTEGLVRRGVALEVLCANNAPRTVHERMPAGYPVTRAASWGTWLSTSMAPALIAQFRQRAHDAELVHVHMPDPLAALAVWAARPKGRLVLHWHSDVVRQRLARHAYRPLEAWLLQRADAIIATSGAYAESSATLQRWRDKTHVIPIGISAPPPPPPPAKVQALRQRYGGRRLVFALGRMAYYKGFEVLIAAAARLPADCLVVVAGGGVFLETHRQAVAKAGLDDRIRFVGRLHADALEAHFAAADVFCLPSTVRAEAYGVVVLEAMARGKPVVTTQIPGSGVTWLNQPGLTGLSVPVRDPAALAAALTAVLADPALGARLGAAGRERWRQHFQAATMVDMTFDLYQSLQRLPRQQASPENDR